MSYSNYFLNDQLKDTASFEYGSLAENINSGSLFRGETGLTDSNGVKKPDTITFGFGVDLRQNSIADIKQSFSDAGRSLSPGEVKVIEDFKAGKINLDDAKKSLNRDIKTTETGQHTFFSTICIAASVIFYLNQ